MTDERTALPEGWVWANLADVVSVVKGRKPKSQSAEPSAQSMPYVTIDTFESGNPKIFTDDLCGPKCSSDDTLLVWDGARAGLCGRGVSGVVGSTIVALRPKGVDSGYLFRFIQARYDDFNSRTRGTGTPHLDPTIVWQTLLPLPPLSEQRRIVAEIEALFEHNRTARAALDRIPPQLKKFRQAVLAAAFRGDLTRYWRDQHPDVESAMVLLEVLRKSHSTHPSSRRRYNAAAPTDGVHNLQRSDFPDSWEVAELAELCEPGRPITYGILKPGPDIPGGVPYVRVADIRGDNIVLDGIRRTTLAIDHAYRRSRLKTGDVLISIRGTVGRVCQVPHQLDGANITQDTARISVDPRVSAVYVAMCLRSPIVQKTMAAAIRGVAVRGINIGDVRALRIPLPSPDEQQQIVARVGELLSGGRLVEAAAEAARRQAEKFNRSILAKAFRGELVSQDPNHEPR